MGAVIRHRLAAWAALILGAPLLAVALRSLGLGWDAYIGDPSGPLAPSPDATPGMMQPADVVRLGSLAVCFVLLGLCIRLGDRGVRARRGTPVLPILVAIAVLAFAWGLSSGGGVVLTAAMLCLGAYRFVLRLSLGGYTDDGASAEPAVPERPGEGGRRAARC